MARARKDPPLTLRWVTLDEVRALPPLPSGYETDRIFHLLRETRGTEVRWELREVALAAPLFKRYDRGTTDEWLESYLNEGDPADMAFLLAEREADLVGLLAYRQLEWNNTLWLLDIRVRKTSRRTGAGSALVLELKARARSLGARGILVETQTTNHPAICFYRRHGFEICGFNDHLYANDDLEHQEVALYLFWETDGAGA